MAYRSFAEQTVSYFDRPHSGLPAGPVGGPAAWRGADLDETDWQRVLAPDEVAELDEARAHARSTGRPLAELTADDFPLPTLEAAVDDWRARLTRGLGFVVIKGLPVERWTEDDASIVFWCLGLHLGEPGEQNVHHDLLGHVVDTGDDRADPLVRLYRTASNIRYHCDAADAVGLLCLHNAAEGGLSRLASSVTVHDELRRTAPELADRLFGTYELDTRNEGSSIQHLPVVPCCYDGERLRTFFHSDYYRSVVRHDDVGPLDAVTLAALDAFEEIAERPDVRLDMAFDPGDVQLVSNHAIVHARTAYVDRDAEPRHLLRLWLTLAGA